MKNRKIRRKTPYRILLAILILGLGIFNSIPIHAAPRVQSYGDELVIVIDPGHGGENLGTIENGFEEKTMTFVTAQTMYEELSQYDNVTVYMTRTDDRDMSLKERAEFAASVGADFMFSLHYNASANHTHFGSEIWISSVTPYNAYGYQFGTVFMKEMEDMGLFLRGIKTKLGNEGDYYGIIREAAALSVPAAILEHCHVDEERDVPYCETEAEWKEFGKRDALAVAQYFGLSSTALGVDYNQESLNLPEANEAVFVASTRRDETAPDICILELSDTNYETGEISFSVTATDYDSPLIYYDYSIDGGETYCAPIAWPGVNVLDGSYQDTFQLSIQIPSGEQPKIIFRAFNLADLYTESNAVPFLQKFIYGQDALSEIDTDDGAVITTNPIVERERHSAGTLTFTPEEKEVEEAEKEVSFYTFLKLCMMIVIVIFFAVLVSQTVSYRTRKKRRRQRIKELERERYHNK